MSKVNRKSPRRKRSVKFRSKFEGRVAEALAKVTGNFKYEPVTFPYRLNLEYKPDWEVDGAFYLEAKGLFDYTERRKILAVLHDNPNIDLRMVFMRDQKIAKNSTMRYSTWCEKYGVRYSIFPELPI